MPRQPTRRGFLTVGTVLASLAGCLSRLPAPGVGDDESTPQAVVWRRELDVAPRDLTADPGATALYANARRDTPFSYDLDGDERWRRDVDGEVAAVTEDSVLIEDSSAVTALDVANGTEDWSFETERHEIVGDLSVEAGRAYVVGEKQATAETDPDEEFVRLYVLDEGDGSVVRRKTLVAGADSHDRNVDAAGDYALVARSDGSIRRFDAEGSERWRTSVTLDDLDHYDESEGFTRYSISPGLVRDGAYYFGISDASAKKVVALEPDDGEILWQRAGVGSVHVVGSDLAYCSSEGRDWQQKRAAFDRDTGEERWTEEIPSDVLLVGAALTDDVLYASTVDNEGDEPSVGLHALDAPTGAYRGTVSVPGVHGTAPVVAGDRVFVGTGTTDSEGTVDEGSLRAISGVHAGGEW